LPSLRRKFSPKGTDEYSNGKEDGCLVVGGKTLDPRLMAIEW
jgi:hypothetical protein